MLSIPVTSKQSHTQKMLMDIKMRTTCVEITVKSLSKWNIYYQYNSTDNIAKKNQILNATNTCHEHIKFDK